jgi:serine protease
VPANPSPARVLNLSLGGTGSCDTATQNAINSALAAGAVVVVAAGNSNSDASGFTPANCNGVITVAATGRQGQRASYSNYGATVEISAPGGSDGQAILSTLNNGTTSPNPSGYDYVYYQGTSMATPHVTGIASLMLSVDPSLTPAQVLATIQTTARAFPTGTVRDCTTALCGSGIVDAAAALRALVSVAASTTSLSSSLNPATVGTPVTLTASVTGTNPTGTVSLADGGSALSGCTSLALSGSGNTVTAACTTSNLAAGTHSLVASYSGDSANAPSSSAALSQVINGVTGDTNVALASVGAVASASSTYSSGYPASAINNNERAGVNPGNGGYWNDATSNIFPDWVQIAFNGSKTIDHVVVYSVQDNFLNPVEPTDTLTFTKYGITDFTVQGWNGSSWVTLATVSGNNLVKRTVSFTAYTTTQIQIVVNKAVDNWSRITELEAWGQ